jgi:NTP pyrophosphatase (non-canonical NTP hydrolase)
MISPKVKKYLAVVDRTENKDVDGVRERFEGDLLRLNHAVLGIGSELGELFTALNDGDTANVIEELGDILWFCGLATNVIGTGEDGGQLNPFDSPLFLKPEINLVPDDGCQDEDTDTLCHLIRMAIIAEQIQTPVKAAIYYGKPLNKAGLREALRQMICSCRCLGEMNGFNMFSIMSANITKLTDKHIGRYKKGTFSSDDAMNRAVAAERAVFDDVVEALGEKTD